MQLNCVRDKRFTGFFLLTFFIAFFYTQAGSAQDTDTIPPVSVDPELEAIFKARTPKEYTIVGIQVTGLTTFDTALLISITGITEGDKVFLPGGDLFSKAISAIWRQQYFDDAAIYITKVDGRDIHIEINVKERSRLGAFFFKGIRKGEEDDLKEKIGLTPNKVITENLRRTSIERIEKFYVDKGYRSISVYITDNPNRINAGFTDLTFHVTKGAKVKIEEVFISGNEIASDLKIKKQLKGTKEKARITLFPNTDQPLYGAKDSVTTRQFFSELGFLHLSKVRDFIDPWARFKFFSSSKFNQVKYEEDKEKILEYYNSLGYRDAAIADDTVYYNRKGNLIVELNIQEGRQYYFGDITWRGNTKYSDSLLTAILGIRKGDIYNLELLNKKLGKQLSQEGGDISGLYMDDGYLFFRIEPIETRVYNDTIDYEIRLAEGPQATIRSVNISGNDKTKEYVIRREIRTVPGEKFSRSDLIRSNRELAALNYFNQEKIGINPIPNPDDGTVDINYSLEEKSSDQLELSAGWGGLIGLTGTLGITFNNFSTRNFFKKSSWSPLPSGDGQRLSLRVQSNGPSFSSQNFSFTEPWLGGKKRNAFTVSIFRTKLANAFDPLTGFPVRGRADNQFLRTMGASVSLGRQLKWPDDYFSLVTAVSYTQYKLKNYPIFPELDSGVSNNFNFRIQLLRSSVDQPMFPRSGSNFSLSATFTPPWSLFRDPAKYNDPAERYRLVEYHKWRLNYEWFVPIGRPMGAEKNRQFVLRAAAKYGFLGRYNTNIAQSPFERFQVGDAGLQNNFGIIGFDIIAHRGYPVYDNSNPRVNNSNQTTANQFFTIFNKYSLELRYPLSTNPSSTIFGLTFFEAANGWYDFKDYNPFKLRRSAGIGMRFFLPMFGLLGFDYGIGFDRAFPGARMRDMSRFTFMLGFEPE
ncbi:MAG TPA: POTRA domain-containing protein [Lacibacter sp.]|nr:POTRA domain-containing protein [Lacibacter sp.]HMO88580.1 POTRA domain-containing protein [Lacibacter sp.]HMP86120.1 POTRA domain-containing protein [Lacibacter sp.]